MGEARPGLEPEMELPLGVADPISIYEMAEHLHMTVGELCFGRGTPMSNYELTVGWPQFNAYKARRQKEAELQAEQKRGRQ